MSNSYKLIKFDCEDCSGYGGCNKGAGLAVWFQHTCNLFHLYQKQCGEWRKAMTLNSWEVEHLKNVIDDDIDNNRGWEYDWEELEKVRYGSSDNEVKYKLIQKLKELSNLSDTEHAHSEAEKALIEFINDNEIKDAYDKVKKWYA